MCRTSRWSSWENRQHLSCRLGFCNERKKKRMNCNLCKPLRAWSIALQQNTRKYFEKKSYIHIKNHQPLNTRHSLQTHTHIPPQISQQGSYGWTLVQSPSVGPTTCRNLASCSVVGEGTFSRLPLGLYRPQPSLASANPHFRWQGGILEPQQHNRSNPNQRLWQRKRFCEPVASEVLAKQMYVLTKLSHIHLVHTVFYPRKEKAVRLGDTTQRGKKKTLDQLGRRLQRATMKGKHRQENSGREAGNQPAYRDTRGLALYPIRMRLAAAGPQPAGEWKEIHNKTGSRAKSAPK